MHKALGDFTAAAYKYEDANEYGLAKLMFAKQAQVSHDKDEFLYAVGMYYLAGNQVAEKQMYISCRKADVYKLQKSRCIFLE